MNGIKTDLVASCHNPQICDECQERLKQERVSKSDIDNTRNDIKRIRKYLYHIIISHVKKHPIVALFISGIFALTLGITGSIIGSFIYEYMKN